MNLRDPEVLAEYLSNEVNEFYTRLAQTYPSTENHFFHPNLTSEQINKGFEFSEETFLVIQDLLAKTCHAKLNIPVNTQIPVDYLVEHAKIDGAINVLRQILDMAHEARHTALKKKLKLA